jgi:hypothetical protein
VKRAKRVKRSTKGALVRRWAVLLALTLPACKAGVSMSKPRPDASRAPTEIFPDAAPPYVAAEPVQHGPGYVRRAYISGEKRVEITIATTGREPGAFERWVEGSASYPQAPLALPTSQANGFFTCGSEGADAPCDLHIQLRSGFHVEAMGNGHVPRADLSELLAQVPLGALSDATFAKL